MKRLAIIIVCGTGWTVLLCGVMLPLVGMLWSGIGRGSIDTELAAVPASLVLLSRSIVLSAVATLGASALGLFPAALLGTATGRKQPILFGLLLAPLIVPPQVYAYAWQCAAAPGSWLNPILPSNVSAMWMDGAIRAGLISAGWLWPVVTIVVAAGWRSTGQATYTLALLDTSPGKAYLRAVIPSLRPYLTAAAAIVFAITLIEYAIPHLTLCHVYATELLVLMEIAAPPGQVMRMAIQVITIVALLAGLAVWSLRSTRGWIGLESGSELDWSGRQRRLPVHFRCGRTARWGSALVWLVTLGAPVGIMWQSLKRPSAWTEGLILFKREWLMSLGIATIVSALSVALAISTVVLADASGRRSFRIAGMATFLSAMVPAAALGMGVIAIFNRPGTIGDLYTRWPVAWILALVARYGIIAVFIASLALGRRTISTREQAHIDGARVNDILSSVLLPVVWPSLLAAGLVITMLAMFEVVLSQLTSPLASGGNASIATTILGLMHYGKDDVVITTSLAVIAAGVMIMQLIGWLLIRPET